MSHHAHRLADWQTRMESFMAQRAAQPFTWGTNDCAIFASDFVQAITGQDPAPPGLRTHRTAKQATRAVARHGGMHAIACAALGEPIAAAFAGVGDVVLVPAGKRLAFGVCNGQTALLPSAIGLAHLSMQSAVCAWRVA